MTQITLCWLVALGVLSCAQNSDRGEAIASNRAALSSAAPTLSACAEGWWFEDEVVSRCTTACLGPRPNPECSQQDCRQVGLLGIARDGYALSLSVSYSRNSQSMTPASPLTKRAFTVQSDGIALEGQREPMLVDCTQDRLSGRYATHSRASQSFSSVADTLVRTHATTHLPADFVLNSHTEPNPRAQANR